MQVCGDTSLVLLSASSTRLFGFCVSWISGVYSLRFLCFSLMFMLNSEWDLQLLMFFVIIEMLYIMLVELYIMPAGL